jgi:hypothetical protein
MTGVVRSTVSGADGGYVLPNLPIGPYLLEVSKEGFSKYAQTGIVLQVDTNPAVDVSMKVGAVSEQVTVEANAAQVETRTTSIGGVVDNKQIMEMPLNGRDAHELVFLAGMATSPGEGSMNSIRNYPTVVVSVAGGNGDGVSYLLDGVIHQDPYNSLSLPLPFPDALQALSRNFTLGERRLIQLRAEAFNLPNHLNPTTPSATLTAPNFGQITNDISGNNGIGVGDYRVVQLAMRFVF